jgi:precorrin-2 dehydrogenase/sirohydrochlorin ferrochelatase
MSEKRFYPLFADLQGRSCLVVGEGAMAAEKVRGLEACGAEVTVVAPGEYRPEDLEGRFLVLAAAREEVNRRVFADAEARSLLCNVADVPELCSFILPAVHREGPLAVAVSTGGASPALAQRIRDEVAARYGSEHAELAGRLEALRPWARENLPTYEERREFFRKLVEEALA